MTKRKQSAGRPPIFKDRRTLNLSVENETKQKAWALASAKGSSISALVTELINRASLAK